MSNTDKSLLFFDVAGGVFVTMPQIKKANPSVSFPKRPSGEDLSPFGVVVVQPTPQPDGDVVIERQPEQRDDGKWYQTWEVREFTPEELAERINSARQEAYDRINAEYESRVQVLAEGYPESEQQSWPVQIREADVVLGEDNEPTPWIDNAAPARGITRQELAQLIKNQDTAYRQYHGTLTGIRQALRDQIAAVPGGQRSSLEALNQISWPETEFT